jgi:hypothetical protein
MKAPIGCVLWREPALVDGPINERFDVLATYIGDDHLWRYLLKCRECGQRYLFQYHEVTGWTDGDRPQDTVYVPVDTDEEIETLKGAPPDRLLECSPRLHRAFMKAERPRIYWVGKPAE